MARHVDRKDKRLPAGVSRIDRHTGGPQRKGAPWCYRVELMANGQRIRQRFEPGTPLTDISDWIHAQRAAVKSDGRDRVIAKGTFDADVENDYLPQVSHLASLREREIDIRRWAGLFKGRNRNTIKPIEIRKYLSAWASVGESNRKNRHGQTLRTRPLSESSLNHRLSALSNFYVLLNGKRGHNPCLDVDRFKEPDRKINAIDFTWVRKILAELPDDNVNSAIIRCLAWTGMRPSQLNRIRRSDIDLSHATVFVPAAKGGRSNPIALPKAGVQAFRRLIKFADEGGYLFADERKERTDQGFEQRTVNWWVKKAAEKAKYPHKITTYWLRHSLATHMLEKGASTREVQHQLTHSSLELIERYAKVTHKGLTRVMSRIA
jgi:site-specific recombinase XerD